MMIRYLDWIYPLMLLSFSVYIVLLIGVHEGRQRKIGNGRTREHACDAGKRLLMQILCFLSTISWSCGHNPCVGWTTELECLNEWWYIRRWLVHIDDRLCKCIYVITRMDLGIYTPSSLLSLEPNLSHESEIMLVNYIEIGGLVGGRRGGTICWFPVKKHLGWICIKTVEKVLLRI